MRFAPIAIAITTICSVPALAESGNADDQRFSFHKVDDGFLRLDGRTGVVALCTRPESGWLCRMVPDERSTVEVEIARLASENAALKSALREREGRLPGQPPRPPAPRFRSPRSRRCAPRKARHSSTAKASVATCRCVSPCAAAISRERSRMPSESSRVK